MNRSETAQVLTVVKMLWPHSTLGGSAVEVLGLWHSFLESYSARDVEAAIRDLAAQGREFAPPVGMVVKTISERTLNIPEWDEVVAEIERGLMRYRREMPPGGFSSEREMHGAPPPEYWSHPAIAAFITPAWHEWRMCLERDRRTFYAQQRDAYKAMAARDERSTALAGIGAPRREGLRRPDYLKALPGGGEAS